MTDIQKAANYLQIARLNMAQGGKAVSPLGLEALLRLLEGPKTLPQLARETGAPDGPLNRALRRFCAYQDKATGEIVEPDFKLLTRERRAEKLKGHLYRLTDDGRCFLAMAGFKS